MSGSLAARLARLEAARPAARVDLVAEAQRFGTPGWRTGSWRCYGAQRGSVAAVSLVGPGEVLTYEVIDVDVSDLS